MDGVEIGWGGVRVRVGLGVWKGYVELDCVSVSGSRRSFPS
jgi:hypothetical protein